MRGREAVEEPACGSEGSPPDLAEPRLGPEGTRPEVDRWTRRPCSLQVHGDPGRGGVRKRPTDRMSGL